MAIIAQRFVSASALDEVQVLQLLHAGLERQFTDRQVLVLIPDHMRTIPLPFLFEHMYRKQVKCYAG